MVRTKLVPRRVRIKPWPPREAYVKFKIKTLLPEQKVVQIKKNRQVIRSVTVGRKTKKFTDKWAKTFCKYCKICLKCQKFYGYRSEFKKKGFWTFNKDVWDVYDPDWSYQNEIFKLEPLKRYRM